MDQELKVIIWLIGVIAAAIIIPICVSIVMTSITGC